jgi:hypothetical protein
MIAETRAGRIFVPYPHLRDHGIHYTRVHLSRLVRAGLFPAPHQLSPNRIAWVLGPADDRNTIEHWLATRPIAALEDSSPPDAAAEPSGEVEHCVPSSADLKIDVLLENIVALRRVLTNLTIRMDAIEARSRSR